MPESDSIHYAKLQTTPDNATAEVQCSFTAFKLASQFARPPHLYKKYSRAFHHLYSITPSERESVQRSAKLRWLSLSNIIKSSFRYCLLQIAHSA